VLDSASRSDARAAVLLTRPVLVVLVLSGMSATMNVEVFSLLLSPLADDLGYSVASLGALRAIEEITAVLTALVITPLMDRFPRRTLLLAGFGLMALAAGTAAASVGIVMLLIYFVVDGISKILLFSSVLALPSDLAAGREHDRALGFVIGSFALAGFTVMPLVGILAAASSWRAGYVVSLVFALLTMSLVALVLPVVQPQSRVHASLRAHARSLVALPGFPAALTGALFRFMLFASVLTYSGAYVIDEHGVSVTRAGFFFSIGALAFLLSSITSGRVIERIGPRHALVTAGVLTAGLLAIALSSGARLAVAGICLVAAVWLMGLLENASTGLLLRLAPHDRGAAMSLNELMAAAGSLLGIGAGAAALRLSGYAGIGALLAAAGLLAGAVTLSALRFDPALRSSRAPAPPPWPTAGDATE
jgi:predicted MFS family arabinose efflux permease